MKSVIKLLASILQTMEKFRSYYYILIFIVESKWLSAQNVVYYMTGTEFASNLDMIQLDFNP